MPDFSELVATRSAIDTTFRFRSLSREASHTSAADTAPHVGRATAFGAAGRRAGRLDARAFD